MKNTSKENYLCTIFRLADGENRIKTRLIAEKLNISNAAVTDMMKRLSSEGYVEYERYREIELTNEGKLYAINIIRRHRIWELYLHLIIGMPWDKVHDEAENLEHSSSDELINRLEEILDYPEFDPHGDPIPDRDGNLPYRAESVPLSSMQVGDMAQVIRVIDFDHKFLTYLSGVGIRLNTEIIVKDIFEFDNSMLIGINGTDINISSTIASNVFVVKK